MRTSADYDIVILGGGPAGTATAITAARSGLRVALLEAGEFPRHKVCGEFVSAESLELLGELLSCLPEAQSAREAAPVIDRARLFHRNRIVESPIHPPARSIPRYQLDALLCDAARISGAQVFSNCEAFSFEGTGPFEIATKLGGFKARALVVATGRWSRFSGKSGIEPNLTTERNARAATDSPRPQPAPKWIGLKAHFHEANPSPTTDLYFFGSGYCGVQPISRDAVNACAMVRSDRATSLAQVFAQHPRLAERARNWRPLMNPISTAPLIFRKPQPAEGHVIRVGDVAAFIDPFVGDGISIALRTGELAARCLVSLRDCDASLADVATRYAGLYRLRIAPLLSASAHLRRILQLPPVVRLAAFELINLPGLLPYIIRKTRTAA